MRSFLLRAAIIAVAIVVAMQLLPDLGFHGSMSDLVVVAAILGAINALVRPVVQLLALPVRLVTLGLATFIVDAAMLLLAAWVAGQVSYCGLDRRRAQLGGDEHRGCWEARPSSPVRSAARPFRDRHESSELVAVASVDLGLWVDRER